MPLKNYTICEHEHLVTHPDSKYDKQGDVLRIPKNEFESIETFILENENNFLIPSYKKGYKRSLKAQQYVGTIQTQKGLTIEILPKIGKTDTQEHDICKKIEDKTRFILIKMLKHLKNSPFKEFNNANLKTQKMHLFDIYITMFCQGVSLLLKKGLRSDYINNEGNMNFLKGKMLFNQNIRYNLANKSKFFVSFDEYSQNRPENKLIKTTLDFLCNKTSNIQNQQQIRLLLFTLEDIEYSKNIKADFSKCKNNRLMKEYSNILMWCRLFLNNESFTSFKGSSIASAIFFDMNKVFEDYLAHWFRTNTDYNVKAQFAGKLLTVEPQAFKLKPDLILEKVGTDPEGGFVSETGKNSAKHIIKIIADTKWKLIKTNKDLSQSDFYQMYAYAKKYEVNEIHLIYPKIESEKDITKEYFFEKPIIEENGNIIKLYIDFFNLTQDHF